MKTKLFAQELYGRRIRDLAFCLIVGGASFFLPLVGGAFSITSVTLTPTNPFPSGSNIVMTVNIATPGSPEWLYQPTTVTMLGNQIGVDVYPASGLLTVIGRLSTNVDMGVLPDGHYQYEVRLHPNHQANWGVRTNRGTFTVLPDFPWTMVTVTAPDAQAVEPVANNVINPGRFTVHRAGTTNVDLLVHYAIGASASNGVDYASISNAIFIPAGQTAADIVINPRHDLLVEGTETVVLRILEPFCPAIYPPPPECYLVGTPREATVYIADNPPTNRPPFVNFFSPPDGATFNAPANIRLIAYAEDVEDGNNLTVEFFNGNVSLGFGTFVPSLCPSLCPNYSLVWSNVPVGKYELSARATDHQGATTNSALVHVSVLPPPPTNQPPTVNIVSPADGATFTAPASIFFIASVHDPDGNVWAANVEFFEGTNRLGNGQLFDPGPPHDAPFRFYWTNVPPGGYTLTARATDEQGATGISPAINITVDPLPTNQVPVVTIKAVDPVATEGTNCYRWAGWPTPLPGSLRGTNTATFVVRRDGNTNASLTVYYQVGGTASNGLDYAELPGTVVIPAGQRIAPITILPVDDVLAEKIETVVLGLYEPPFASPLPPPYSVGKPGRAAVIIVDNDEPRPCTGRLPDGCFHLAQPGANGGWYRIEFSTNLIHWTALCTNSVTDGAIHFFDPDADTASQRFYRAVPENNPPTD